MSLNTIYATLSHCCDGRCDKILTSDTLRQFEESIPLASLPKSFQDAIVITQELGVSYMWIDALCIIQDSDNDEEWRREASFMGDIYANSYVTLAASNSLNLRVACYINDLLSLCGRVRLSLLGAASLLARWSFSTASGLVTIT